MDKKEFIFPGTILGIVLVIALGLIITQPNEHTTLGTTGFATSTNETSSTSSPTSATIVAGGMVSTPSHSPSPVVTHYYPYGTTTLLLNQAAGFKNAVSIRPTSVLSDSRCPAEVQCIQAGTLTLSLRISGQGKTEMHTLHIGQTIVVFGTRITFDSVTPERHVAGARETSPYRFTFTVEPTS